MGDKPGLADTGGYHLALAGQQEFDGLLEFVGYLDGVNRVGFLADDAAHVFFDVQIRPRIHEKGALYLIESIV